jgi:hypothetical protein
MVDLTDFAYINVVPVEGTENWELVAYDGDPHNHEGVVIKIGSHAEMESLMVAMSGTMVHSSFAPTTPTFH